MKAIIILVLALFALSSGYDRKAFSARLQQAKDINTQIIKQQAPEKLPLIPIDTPLTPLTKQYSPVASPAESPFDEDRLSHNISLSEKIGYMSAEIKDLKQDNTDLKQELSDAKEDIGKISDNLLLQAQTAKTQSDKSGTRDTLINGLVAVLIALIGSGGTVYWKNRKIIKLPIIHKDKDDTKDA